MAIKNFPPPPTYADPTIIDPKTGVASFNPIWLQWFLEVAAGLGSLGLNSAGQIPHNALGELEGGIAPDQFYHMSAAQFNAFFTSPMTDAGDLIIGGGGGFPTRIPVGSNGQVLTVVSGVPTWV